MKLDDRDIVCQQDYTPLSNAELVEAIERYAAIMHTAPLIDFDLEWITGPARALAARVAELEATLGRLDALAPDYELPDGAAVAEAIASGYILTAGCRDIHGKVAGVAAVERNNEMLRARVAELEAQLAAQQWRPVTNDWPPYNERVIIGYGGGYGGGWCVFARRVRTDDRDDWLMDDDTTLAFESAVVAMRRPLPPAPQEPTR